jgi:hypothetical protein
VNTNQRVPTPWSRRFGGEIDRRNEARAQVCVPALLAKHGTIIVPNAQRQDDIELENRKDVEPFASESCEVPSGKGARAEATHSDSESEALDGLLKRRVAPYAAGNRLPNPASRRLCLIPGPGSEFERFVLAEAARPSISWTRFSPPRLGWSMQQWPIGTSTRRSVHCSGTKHAWVHAFCVLARYTLVIRRSRAQIVRGKNN